MTRDFALSEVERMIRDGEIKDGTTVAALGLPDLLEPTDEIRGLCTFVARDLHEVRSLMLAVGSVC